MPRALLPRARSAAPTACILPGHADVLATSSAARCAVARLAQHQAAMRRAHAKVCGLHLLRGYTCLAGKRLRTLLAAAATGHGVAAAANALLL
jgi:hypothetical protein